MPHQDQGRWSVRSALEWIVVPGMFQRISFRRDSRWTPASLVQAALLWAWSEEAALVDRFFTAQQIIAQQSGEQHESVSYQAFLKLLRRRTQVLLAALVAALQRRMERSLADCYRVAGYLAFGIDGTRIDVPRTAANEQAFAPRHCRTRRRGRRRRADEKKVAAPRLALTLLWHLGSGLPWSWRRSSSEVGERAHLLEMLSELPERALLVADAGFVGYDFWQAILAAGHDLVIRVGANVTLLKRLGYYRECQGRVYLWPDSQRERGRPPLVLRLVVAASGRQPVYLVTSVLAKTQLSDRQLIELYRARWGVEVFYRSFKRSFGRHKLRSAAPENAQVELDWSLAALWAAALYAKCQQQKAGHDVARTSIAGVLRIVRRAFRQPHFDLAGLLALALVDRYTRRHKASRDYPRKKTDAPGDSPPLICTATKLQLRIAHQIKRLTA
jgi:hypothetical protein